MPYEIQWLVEKRLLLTKPVGDISIDEVEEAIARMQQMMDDGDSPIHTISDNRYVEHFPNSLSALKKLMSPHPKAKGWSILIQENMATRFVSEMVTRFAGQNHLKSFVTLQEGIAFLERNDKSLGKIPNPEEA